MHNAGSWKAGTFFARLLSFCGKVLAPSPEAHDLILSAGKNRHECSQYIENARQVIREQLAVYVREIRRGRLPSTFPLEALAVPPQPLGGSATTANISPPASARSLKGALFITSDTTTDIATRTPPRIFRKAGEAWIVTFNGKTVHIKAAKGMDYICQLLQSPGQSFHSFQLVAAAAGQSGAIQLGSAGELIDEDALRAYRERIDDIESRLSIAERDFDQAQKEALMEEKERIEDEIQSAVGLRGQLREAYDDAEKARKSVSNAISRAITAIREHHAPAADHLHSHVECGIYHSYTPPDDTPWDF